MPKETWLRDALLEPKECARLEGLEKLEEALRVAIIQVSLEQNIATLLSIIDLIMGVHTQCNSVSVITRPRPRPATRSPHGRRTTTLSDPSHSSAISRRRNLQ